MAMAQKKKNPKVLTRAKVEQTICLELLAYVDQHRRHPTLIKLSPDAFKILTDNTNRKNITYFKIKVVETPEVDEATLVELGELH